MVTQELVQWLYLWKIHKRLLLIPVVVAVLCLLADIRSEQLAKDMAVFLLFPSLVFPIVGLLMQMGSLHQKELFITLPISPWTYGIVRPVLLCTGYGLFYAAFVMKLYRPELAIPAGVAAILFMLVTAVFIAFFKNSPIGLCLSLIILFFGWFTTGIGFGPLYFMQWYRSKPGIAPDQYVLEQLILCLLCAWTGTFFVKYRNQFHITKD